MEIVVKKGWKLNPNALVVSKIKQRIVLNNGNCPCYNEADNPKCPCSDYLEKDICHCNLYLKDSDNG